MQLIASYDRSGSIWSTPINIKVIQDKKPRKPKKIKAPRKTTIKKPIPPNNKVQEAQTKNTFIENIIPPNIHTTAPVGLLFIGGGVSAFLFRKKINKLNTDSEQEGEK